MTLLRALGLLLFDLAATVMFLIVVLVTQNVPLAIVAGMALGVAQIAWQLLTGRPVGTMHWLSLILVLGFGGVSLLTGDPRFVMLKPSLIYIIVGAVMLKRGWMTRYLPPIAVELVPDVATAFGFIWAALMFFSAALNIVVALNLSVEAWAAFMSVYGLASKLALLVIQWAVLRAVAVRRRRAAAIEAAAA